MNEIITQGVEEGGRLRIDYLPFPTKHCDLCKGREDGEGKTACEKACQARCIWHGSLDGLAEMMEDKPHAALFTPVRGALFTPV
jgi:hypothetical protein